MKLYCSKCSGIPQGGALFVEDGVECPICGGDRKEETDEGKTLSGGTRKEETDEGKTLSGGTRKEESGGPR